jgi:type IV pilus assembly protein PilW
MKTALHHRHLRREPVTGSRARGFSLVELMVAIVLGLFIVIGLLTLIVSNSISRAELDKSSRQIENGRFALAQLTEDIEHAGFTGSTSSRASGTVSQQIPPLCPNTMSGSGLGYSAAANYVATVPYSVYGPDASASGAGPCISNYKNGTAIIVISRVSTSTTNIAGAASAANVAYLQASTCATETIPFAVSAGASGAAGFPLTANDCATAALLRPLIQRIYFVSTCNVCSPSDSQPTLKVAEYDGTGAKTVTPLVEGIEDMQFDYGIDTDNNGAPDSYSATPLAADWPNVVTVRIHVLARNEDPSGGWTDTRTYDMGLAEGTVPATAVSPCPSGFCDNYKRHVYSGVARLYNISGQRELQ